MADSNYPPIALLVQTDLHYARQVALGVHRFFAQRMDAPPVAMVPTGRLSHQTFRRRLTKCSGVVGFASKDDAVHARRRRLPTVIVNTAMRGDYARVVPDHAAVGRQAAEHLLAQGHRRVAIMAYRHPSPWEQRYRALQQAVTASGGMVTRIHWTGDATAQLAAALGQVTAAFAPTDRDAQRLIDVASQLGLNVPADLAVMGADDDTFLCEMSAVPLTSVDLQPRRIGYAAAEHLWNAIQNGSLEPTVVRVPPRGVTVRRSTDALAYEDPNVRTAMRMIQRHACEEMTIDTVMEGLTISRRTLETRFRQDVGRTLLQEIHRVRFDRATHLLVHSDLPVKEIARRCGYPDHCRFSTQFRRRFGVPPSAYRLERRVRGQQ
ncbi:MAG: substrate-binding domain-containing protein [bacterium]